MRDTVTVSAPPGPRRELDRTAAREGVSRGDVMRAPLAETCVPRSSIGDAWGGSDDEVTMASPGYRRLAELEEES